MAGFKSKSQTLLTLSGVRRSVRVVLLLAILWSAIAWAVSIS